MNDTVLYLRAGIYRLNGGRKAGQVIRAGNKAILYAAVLEPIAHRCPEFRTFVFADPHAKDVLLAAQINTDCDIDSFLDDLAFTSHMVMDRIQEHHSIYCLQRTLLAFLCYGQ